MFFFSSKVFFSPLITGSCPSEKPGLFHLFCNKTTTQCCGRMILNFICFSLPSTHPAPEHLSFPLGSPLLCFILTWVKADQTFSSCFFSSFSPSGAAEALQLIFHFQCFMYNAAGPFIKVKMSVRAEGRPEVQSQRDPTAERGRGRLTAV